MRCDANGDVGLGHLSRCLGLAEALRALGGAVAFMGEYVPPFQGFARDAGFDVIPAPHLTGTSSDADAVAREAASHGAAAVCADDYRIDAEWLERVAHAAAVVLVDDFGERRSYADCRGVLNFTVGAAAVDYPGLTETHVLRGPGFFPARANLHALRASRNGQVIGGVRRVLVTLGGGNRHPDVWRVLEALRRFRPDVQVRALVSPALASAPEAPPFAASLETTTRSMAEAYGWADVCIAGGGLTKYECGYLGLPVAIVSQTPDQQAETLRFAGAGLGFDLGCASRREQFEERLERFLDGDAIRRDLARRGLDTFCADGPARAARGLLSWL